MRVALFAVIALRCALRICLMIFDTAPQKLFAPCSVAALLSTLMLCTLPGFSQVKAQENAQPSDVAIAASDRTANVDVFVNMARIVRLGAPAATIVVGNPAIAGVTIQDPRTLVLTGKAFGATNMIIMDAAGNPIADTTVQVKQRADKTVAVYMADQRRSFACEPSCEPTIIAGDSTDFTANNIASSSIISNAARQQ